MLVNALEAAVGAQQLRRRLVAHARHAGDVVGAVALQSQEIGELRRLHTVTLAHLARAVDGHVGDALARGDHVRELGTQLVDVLIARDQQRAVTQRLVARRNGSQDIVALPAHHAHHGNAHGFEQLLDDGELRLQSRVHGRTLGLVLLERLGAELRPPGIEGAHDGVGIGDIDELEQHGYEAEHRVGGRAVRGVHGQRHRMEGAVHQRVAVDDGHFLLRHRASFRLVALSHHYISDEGKAAPTASDKHCSPASLRAPKIADAAHRLQMLRELGAELCADASDVHVDGTAASVVIEAPHTAQQGVAAVRAARMRDQKRQ